MAEYSAVRLVKRKQHDGLYRWQAHIELHFADDTAETPSKVTGIERNPPSGKDKHNMSFGVGA